MNDQPVEARNTYDQLITQFKSNANASRWTIRSAVADYISQNYPTVISKLQHSRQPKARRQRTFGDRVLDRVEPIQTEQFASAEKSLASSFANNKQWKRTARDPSHALSISACPKKGERSQPNRRNFFERSFQLPLTTELHYRLGDPIMSKKNMKVRSEHFQLINNTETPTKFTPFRFTTLPIANFKSIDIKRPKKHLPN